MSLYQKYRPQEFENLAGQEHVKKTLKSALKQNMVAHAYLFCGPRGTGKTTTARLIAKSLNCSNFNTETAEPCDKCEICVAIRESRFIDVIEIDAASNRGIDEIRELKETIQFAPSLGKNKVYIIDEVHMLTNEAFNALLKTLEEPPENVFFVLATTEVHKIPETIISRCQRFDFKRINTTDLIARLKFIAEAEKLSYEDEALEMIALYSNGGLRDAISILDQLAVSQNVTAEETRKLLGSTGIDTIYKFLDCVLNGKDQEALQILKDLHEQGSDFNQFRLDVLKIAREKLHLAIEQNDLNGKAGIIRLIETWQEIQNKFKQNLIPELPLEILVVRMCNDFSGVVRVVNPPVTNNLAEVKSVENKVNSPEIKPKKIEVKVETPAPLENLPLKKTEETRKITETPTKETNEIIEPGLKKIPSEIAKDWKQVVDKIEATSLKRMLKNTEYQQLEGNSAEISVFSDFEYNIIKKAENIHSIETLIEAYTGEKIHVSLAKKEAKFKPGSWDQNPPATNSSSSAEMDSLMTMEPAGGNDFELLDMFDGEEV